MESKPKILDTYQIVGFIVSTAISVGFIIAQQDTLASVTLGLYSSQEISAMIHKFDFQNNTKSEN